jgi:hypothetical protein
MQSRHRRTAEIGLIVLASAVAALSARDYAGGWNDGSRLATVESLVDRHTLVIDDSIFVRSPATADAPNPYTPGDELLRTKGTQDKLRIGGHYYSDKSPLPAFWLAAWYQLLKSSVGLSAPAHPHLFCYLMTLASSGIAYVVSVWSAWRLALGKGLPLPTCFLLAASFGLATVALPYSRHMNNHLLLLAVVSLLMLALDSLNSFQSVAGAEPRRCPGEGLPGHRLGFATCQPFLVEGLANYRLAAAGTLTGLGYTCDLGLGPMLVLCTTALVAYRTRSFISLACFAAAALPWLAAHHAVNYSTGGTISPANSVAEYLAWPGSPFNTKNMTGGWAHNNIGHFLLYSAALLFGKHGFVNYNLPLYLAPVAVAVLWRRRPPELPEIAFAVAFSGGAWLLYAALSNNYSGPCCSIRWFVPLLAPGYYLLVVLLRERPMLVRDLEILALFGAVLEAWLWWRGPWDGRVPWGLWPINLAALIAWSALGKIKSRADLAAPRACDERG